MYAGMEQFPLRGRDDPAAHVDDEEEHGPYQPDSGASNHEELFLWLLLTFRHRPYVRRSAWFRGRTASTTTAP
jgi:hypothetical protein